jgi:hypothetical protein
VSTGSGVPAPHATVRDQDVINGTTGEAHCLFATETRFQSRPVKGYLDELTGRAAAPVIAKYTGVLAAADVEVFTTTTTFAILQSIRLDLGPSSPVHPGPQHTEGRGAPTPCGPARMGHR